MSALAGQRPEGDIAIDISDVEHRVGRPLGGGQLIEPCTAMDIRRWAMGMDNPNPIHWDEKFARSSKFGGIVAPQSICVGLDWHNGVAPCLAGHIPNSHLLFGGEEWWFYGHRIRPGDKLSQTRRFHDCKKVNTKFAGPSLITRGDTLHTIDGGTPVAKQRSTAIRYLLAEAERRKGDQPPAPKAPAWTSGELQEVANVRRAWILSNREGRSPRFEEVRIGDKLPRRAIGPHSVASFATEWRAYAFTTWGAYEWVGVPGMPDAWIDQDSGFVPPPDYEEAKVDPRAIDGLFQGAAAGHVDAAAAEKVGLPRAYGFGASMGAWATDYLAYWAGHDGMVRHSKVSFRSPAYEGDVTYVDGEVTDKQIDSPWGGPTVTIRVRMTNQDGTVVVDGSAEVEIPL